MYTNKIVEDNERIFVCLVFRGKGSTTEENRNVVKKIKEDNGYYKLKVMKTRNEKKQIKCADKTTKTEYNYREDSKLGTERVRMVRQEEKMILKISYTPPGILQRPSQTMVL